MLVAQLVGVMFRPFSRSSVRSIEPQEGLGSPARYIITSPRSLISLWLNLEGRKTLFFVPFFVTLYERAKPKTRLVVRRPSLLPYSPLDSSRRRRSQNVRTQCPFMGTSYHLDLCRLEEGLTGRVRPVKKVRVTLLNGAASTYPPNRSDFFPLSETEWPLVSTCPPKRTGLW